MSATAAVRRIHHRIIPSAPPRRIITRAGWRRHCRIAWAWRRGREARDRELAAALAAWAVAGWAS